MSSATINVPDAHRLSWRQCQYGHGLEDAVPAVGGIYVIVKTTKMHGLPIACEWIYAGQSKNLKRRYRQHHHWTEPNPGLDALRYQESYEFWWAAAPPEALNEIEADLIYALNPSANRQAGNRPRKK